MRRTFEELFGVRNLSQEVAEKIISEVELGYVKYLVPAIKGVAGLLNKYPRVIVKSLCISEALAHKCGYDHYLHEGDVIPVGIKVSYLHEGENINGTGHLVVLEILAEVFNETT